MPYPPSSLPPPFPIPFLLTLPLPLPLLFSLFISSSNLTLPFSFLFLFSYPSPFPLHLPFPCPSPCLLPPFSLSSLSLSLDEKRIHANEGKSPCIAIREQQRGERATSLSNRMKQGKRPPDGVYGAGALKDQIWLLIMGRVVACFVEPPIAVSHLRVMLHWPLQRLASHGECDWEERHSQRVVFRVRTSVLIL